MLTMFNEEFKFSMANFYRVSSPLELGILFHVLVITHLVATTILSSPPRKHPSRKVLFLHNNCISTSKREEIGVFPNFHVYSSCAVKQLMNYIPIHSLSTCLNNNATFSGDSIVFKEELKNKVKLAGSLPPNSIVR